VNYSDIDTIKNDDRKLRVAHERLSFLIENAPLGFIEWDNQLHIKYWSKRAEEIFGWDEEELNVLQKEGKNPVYEEDLPWMSRVAEQLLSGEIERNTVQHRNYTKDGRVIWCEWHNSVLKDEDGKVISILSLVQDINDRKIAEAALISNEEKYRAFVKQATEAFIALDKNWCYIYLNKQAGEMIHKDPETLIGRNVWEVFPDLVGSSTYVAFHKAMQEQCYACVIDYYETFDLWYENHIYPSAEGLTVFIRDITEKKKAEQQKEFDSNNLFALINNTEDLMWSVDRELRLITFNNAFDEFIKLISGKPLFKGDYILSEQFTEDQLMRYPVYYNRALSGETFNIIEHITYPEEFWLEISFYPIGNPGSIIGTACFSRNITARIKSERTLKQMEQEILKQKVQEQKKISRAIIRAQEKERNHLGQELHDNISQILVGAKIFLGTTGHKNDEMKALTKYPIELIERSISEIRLLSSSQVTPFKDFDLEELVESQLNKLSENSAIKTIFEYHVSKDEVNDDLKLNIYRIVQEQINNIQKFADPKNVSISIEADRDSMMIVTIDDGKGFDVNKKRNGIGLSNMINRIESFDGKIDIKSSPGHGCKIVVAIPINTLNMA
jgi:PAS domain S-box-containing protein